MLHNDQTFIPLYLALLTWLVFSYIHSSLLHTISSMIFLCQIHLRKLQLFFFLFSLKIYLKQLQCSLQFCMKLVDIAGCKMQICKIGLINFCSCLYTNTCDYTSYNKEKYRKNINIFIIHKKINLNYHFTVPGFAMKIGLSRKIGLSQNRITQNWRKHCAIILIHSLHLSRQTSAVSILLWISYLLLSSYLVGPTFTVALEFASSCCF